MKVLHLVSSTDRRGAQVFATQLAGGLGGPPDQLVVALHPGSTPERLGIATLGERRWDPGGFLRLVAGLRRVDLLIAHGSSALLHGAGAASLTGTPFVYRNIGDPSSWGDVAAADLRIGAPLRRAATVVALYPDAAEHMVRSYRLRRDRVRVIPNAVAMLGAPDDRDRAAAVAALGLDESLTWVGFLGALSEEKGILAAIRAISAAPGLALLVAGAGPLEHEARELATQVAPGQVRFVGVVRDPSTILAAVEVLILPSRTEGIPGVAIEAGLAELPVVATRVGGLSTVVLDGVTGVLVDRPTPTALAAALGAALSRRASFGPAARRHCVEHFTLERVVPQWAALAHAAAAGTAP